ncbi:MAG: pantoate--beta-alanine ligase [Isosphaeraceae bacterium]|nr:pantoate--beta-alanine ligase [Isosphaeraceae bacterium]
MSIRVVETIADLRAAVAGARREGATIGFVPTMGALHAGHARLVEVAREETDFVVVSIFVNPTQFGPKEDFSRYPRTLESDLAICGDAGAALVFTPSVEAIYPPSPGPRTYVEVPGLSDILEGASRPGHFRGVATVVMKLFQMVQPDVAFFGRKDFQQLRVIEKMTSDLDLPVRIRPVATVRESDGLAMSSRNRYLDDAQRKAATVLSRALRAAENAVTAGERDADRVRQILVETIESESSALLDYAEVADAATLEALARISPGQPAVALLAARVGPARLIDNAILPEVVEDADQGPQE